MQNISNEVTGFNKNGSMRLQLKYKGHLYLPAPDPLLGPRLSILAPNLYLPALVPNLCGPTLAPNLYLPAMPPKFKFAVPGPNLYLQILDLNVCLPTLTKNKSFFGPGP